jgi:hypothetical protein
MELESIKNKEDLVAYIHGMVKEATESECSWENNDLPSFLEAMAGWIQDMDGYYISRGEKPPMNLAWKTIAEILRAATIYE